MQNRINMETPQTIVFTKRAFNAIVTETISKHPIETGGIFLGYLLDNDTWIVIENVSPGFKSTHRSAYFEYDTDFVTYLANVLANQYKGNLRILGLWHRHPGLFRSVGRNATPVAADEDTIYGIDFATETERAVARGDYHTAVRYTYLHTLKRLDDAHRISWQPYKAPNEYIYELRDADTDAFRRLTNAFLRVRYGNHVPTRAFYEETARLADAVCAPRKGGEA